MPQEEQRVSTEAQRLALEAMSAQLVHKLNAMIRAQEERSRQFAEQHHATLPNPQQAFTTIPEQAQPRPEPRPQAVSRAYTPAPPPPPATKAPVNSQHEHPQPRPVVRPPRKTEQPEESNIGMGMVIFALVGIMILIRSCT